MLSWLKTHPFAVEAFFEHSLVLTFAAPRAEVQALLPAPLVVDTFADEWGFLAVALVQTRHLRPQGFPSWLGQDFFLIGYRVFVRYPSPSGKRLRGLYILRSETDKKRMTALGNLFTHYQYHTVDIAQRNTDGHWPSSRTVRFQRRGSPIRSGGFACRRSRPLPPGRKPAGLPGLCPLLSQRTPAPARADCRGRAPALGAPSPWPSKATTWGFSINLISAKLLLANAFALRDVPYHWKKGRLEKWSH
jgi:hypothetical protein